MDETASVKLSILIPVYDEIRTLESVLKRVRDTPLSVEKELVIVDDGSTDGSREFLEAYAKDHEDVVVAFHQRNRGKGAAIRTAIEHMTGDWAIVQDADYEYDPRDIDLLLAPVHDGVADAVFGSRFLRGRYSRALFFWHSCANKFLTLVTNIVSDLNLTDMETGYKLVRADILKQLNLRSEGFDLEPELAVKLARWGARIYEVPISYRGRTYDEGKKIGPKDAVMALFAIIRYRFFDPNYCKFEGFMTLQAVQRAKGFNRWMFNQFSEYLGDEVLEAGAGIGNLTRLVLDKKRLVAVDYEDFYANRLHQAYGHMNNVSFPRCDLSDGEATEAALGQDSFDSVFSINVIEHIEDDVGVLKNFLNLLKPGGRAIILVPNNPRLYSGVDKALGHHRRYTKDALRGKMEEAGFTVIAERGFNRVGALGWRVSGKLLRRKTLGSSQMRLFELALPLIKLLEKIPFHCFNSLIVVGRKPD